MFAVEEPNTRETRSSTAWCQRPSWLTQAVLLHYYCISFITAIACLSNTSGSESQFPQSLPYGLMESHFSPLHPHWYTHTQQHIRTLSHSLFLNLKPPPPLHVFFLPSLLWSYFSPLWRTAITICLGNTPLLFTSLKLLRAIISRIKRGCFAPNVYSVFYSWVIF